MTDHLQILLRDLKGRLRGEVITLALRHRPLDAGEVRRIDRAIAEWLVPLEDEARAVAVATAAGSRAAAAYDAIKPETGASSPAPRFTEPELNEETTEDAPNEDHDPDHR